MVNVEISDKVISNHGKYICDSEIEDRITDLKNEKMIDILKEIEIETEEHIRFCDFLLEHYNKLKKNYHDQLFTGNVNELKEIIEDVNEKFPNVHNWINSKKKMKYEEEKYQYWQIFFWALGYDDFSKRGISCSENEFVNIYNFKKDSIEDWGAYAYVLSLGLKVCPYCNRNYITPIYSENGKVRADLDHFFPKHKYPYLSISLYNLVPSCKFCNSSLKGKDEFSYSENFHPFSNIDVDKLYKFTYLPKNVNGFIDEEELDVEILYDKIDKRAEMVRKNNEVFCIKELYQYHKDLICRLIKKRIIYSEEYIQYLYQQHNNLFKNENEVKELLLQFDISDINNTPLGKLSKDIIKELDF